ncbi:MFS transporter [Planosporangium mesophilum]|uniref:MFS transporter n=1 Tax=Planosporangium mesophilum TaxID=689768 RepID=A0A8J3TCM9_9ACTN|nr:MFS transporter [Planosporangium mesophilum]NJC83927.1 MFS transporter [Planosporangium mesophilum]GII22707.1 MFS transporter [Planosporangium mesophilum]
MVGSRDRLARTGVAGVYFVQGMCFAALLTRVPALQEKFGFSEGQLSLVLLAVPVVAGVGSVLAGLLATRFGSAIVLRVGGLGVCASIVGTGLVASRTTLYLDLAAVGLFLGLVDAAMNMQGVAVQRRYGRPVLASFHGVWSAGAIAGALATAVTAHWRWALGSALGAVALLGAAIALAAGPRLLRPAEEVSPVRDNAVTRIPWAPIVAVGTAMMLMYIADSATSNWSAVYLHTGLHSSQGVAALGLAAYQTCMVVGRAFADRLVARHGPVRAVSIGGAVGVLGLLVVVVARSPAVGIAGFAVLGLGLCVVVPQSFSVAGQLDPGGTGIAVARVNLFNYVGFVVGAALIGLVAQSRGLRAAFLVPAVLAVGIVVLARSFRPRAVAAGDARGVRPVVGG